MRSLVFVPKRLQVQVALPAAVFYLILLLFFATTTTPSYVHGNTCITKTTVASPLSGTKGTKKYASFELRNTDNANSRSNNKNKNKKRVEEAAAVIISSDKSPEKFTNNDSFLFLKSAYHWYLKSCTDKPFLTKGITSGIIAAIGDVIAQILEATSKASAIGSGSGGGGGGVQLNPRRIGAFFLCNALFTGPYVHIWYKFLNIVGQKTEKRYNVSKLKNTILQVGLDQTLGVLVFFPLYIFVYDIFDSLLTSYCLPSWNDATEKCMKHVWGIILTQYRIFPISNMINFGVVPFELRVLWTNAVSLFWNIYLCSVLVA